MVLGFKKRFVAPIMAGTKIHTIRLDKTERWNASRKIQMATGVRTRDYNCFKEVYVKSVQRVFMSIEEDGLHISIDGIEMCYMPEKEIFAKNDGFDNWASLVDFFFPVLKKEKDQCFSGRIIHWTDFKY